MSKHQRIRSHIQLLGRYLAPQWRAALALSIVLLLSIGLQLVNPQIIRGFIDAAQAQAEPTHLLLAAATFLATGIGVQALRLASTYLSTDLGFRTTNALRADLARHCLGLDMSFHKERTPGELIERIDGDVTSLSNFFTQFVVRLLGNGILIVGIIALLVREDWRVGLIMGAFAALGLAGLIRYGGAAVADSAAEREANAELYGFIEERLGGLDDIRANGSAPYTLRRYYETLRNLFWAATTAWDKRLIVIRIAIGMWGLGQTLALALGIIFYTRGVLTIGAVYMVLHYTNMLLDPLEQIAHQLQDLQKAAAGVQRIGDLMALEPQIRGRGLRALPEGALPIAFDDVSFAYEDDEPVLDGVTFRLEAGAKLGLLGRTGSGKTTLTRLLFRLYDPTAGAIRFGDAALHDLEPDYLRRQVAMVTQDVQLFRASVRDNLTFFDPTISDDEIVRVIRQVGLGDWFERLPKGLDTELAPGGGDLSAGQAQLLAFARVFLTDPSIVVLDEPSSRLDPATERLLEEAMNLLLEGRTGIIIAHRLATVQRVDNIMILADGRIREFGRRKDLVSDPHSHFSELLTTGMEEAFA